MTQDALDFFGMSRTADPVTSKDAAAKVDARGLSKLVLKALKVSPKTSEETAAFLGRELGSITPRFKPLETAGLIQKTGTKRAGKSGSQRVVWEVTLLGAIHAA